MARRCFRPHAWLYANLASAFGAGRVVSHPLTLLHLAAFLLPLGRVADIYGQRLLWLVGTAFFAAFSLGVSLAPTSVGFTAICALLGLSSAAYVPAGVGVLGSYFAPGPTKNRAFASLGAGQVSRLERIRGPRTR